MSAPETKPDMPTPTPELVLIATLVQAFLEELPRKRRPVFLRRVSSLLELQMDFANVIRIRGKADDEALADARVTASEWWKRALSLFLPHC